MIILVVFITVCAVVITALVLWDRQQVKKGQAIVDNYWKDIVDIRTRNHEEKKKDPKVK